MKRTLSIILSLIMVFTIAPVAVFAQAEECTHTDFKWVYYGADSDYDCTKETGLRYKLCNTCGNIGESESVPVQPNHYYVETKKDAPCAKDNPDYVPYIYYECDICDATTKTVRSDAAHIWGENEIYIKCFEGEDYTKAGKYIRECKACGETELLDITDHRYIVTEGIAPTCYKEGTTTNKRCLTCSSVTPVFPVEKLSHTDKNADDKCDYCSGSLLPEGGYCGCLCHNQSEIIRRFLLPILKLIWKIIGLQNCRCGIVHV